MIDNNSLFPGIVSKRRTPDDLVADHGYAPRPTGSSLVLCHGTFDVVHPGHLRQFAFAKQLGAYLVVSVTSDRWVSKDGVRPYVPEEIRLLNLSAIEIIDAVILDDNETPMSLISELRPDIFVKGFDYSSQDKPETISEANLVEEHGGKMVFSPGDYSLSSSQIISNRRFSIGREKALQLMDSEDIAMSDIELVVERFDNTRVLVVGDLIVDRVTNGLVSGTSGKTPTISARETSSQDFVGGAGVVAMHLAAAGANVKLLTSIGDDQEGEWAKSQLGAAGIEVSCLSAENKPTIVKQEFVIGTHHVLKWGRVDSSPISRESQAQILEELSSLQEGIVVFSDFRHGIFSTRKAAEQLAAVRSGITTSADSQVASRWGNILDFAGADILTPNEKEARFALGDQDSALRPLGDRLLSKSGGTNLLILKASADGLIGFRRVLSGSDPRHFFALDSMATSVVDAVGSGDALLAYATLAWHHQKSHLVACLLGSAAAAIQCQQVGNIPIGAPNVLAHLRKYLFD